MITEQLATGTEPVALKLSHLYSAEYATIELHVVYVANNSEFGNSPIGNYLDKENEHNKYNSLVISAQIDADECRAYSWCFGYEMYGIIPEHVMAMKAPVLARLKSAYDELVRVHGEPSSFSEFTVLVAKTLNVNTVFVKPFTEKQTQSIYKRTDACELKHHVDSLVEKLYKQLEAEEACKLQYA